MELDLSSVKSCLSGPKRPHDRVELSNMKNDFNSCLELQLVSRVITSQTRNFQLLQSSTLMVRNSN